MNRKTALIMAGVPATHASIFHRIRFSVLDQVALIELPENSHRILILRDIEMERASQQARVSTVHCPAEFTPADGLSGDRETATAQAAAECLRQDGVQVAIGDRSLPLIYVEMIRRAGIEMEYDADLGVKDRRQKDAEEVDHLRESQKVTEAAIEMACRTIANASADAKGVLIHEGQALTSERIRFAIDQFLSARDCTRTVVHGDIPDEVIRMHTAVAAAKSAGIAATRSGVTGESVHKATLASIADSGYAIGLPTKDASDTYCGMTHGTGHGIGLEVHEPPLLDFKGPELLSGDALTIEPGLYCQAIGAVRLEDMVVVRDSGCENLNVLPEDLDWSGA